MEPASVGPAQWAQVAQAMIYLYAFIGLALTTAFTFLLAHAVLPSLIMSEDAPAALGAYRRVLYPLSVVALVLTLYAFARGLVLAVGVLQQFYPRWSI